MKVRVGIALGQWPNKDIPPTEILDLVDSLEALDVDSLWVSDRLVSALSPRTDHVSFLRRRAHAENEIRHQHAGVADA